MLRPHGPEKIRHGVCACRAKRRTHQRRTGKKTRHQTTKSQTILPQKSGFSACGIGSTL
jgi:hypothetical protein